MWKSLPSSQKTAILVAIISGIFGLIAVLIPRWDKDSSPAPAPVEDAWIRKEKRETIARKISNHLIHKRYDEVNDDFSEELKAYLPVSKIRIVTDSVTTTLGSFVEQTATKSEKDGYNNNVVIVTNRFTTRNVLVMVIFDDYDKVRGLFLQPSQ